MRLPRLYKPAAALAVVLSATIAGCSCEVQAGGSDAESVDAVAVETGLRTELTRKSGVPPASIDCPDEMVAEEGRRYECTVVHPDAGPQTVVVAMRADGGFVWNVP